MVLVVMVLTVSLAASKISKVLQNVTESLKKQSRAVQDQAGSVLKNSEQLASASNQQAAALQETTSTLEQIEATVQKNLETTQTSEGLSLKSKEASVRGVMAMGRLNQAMSSVNATQQSSEQQMKQSFVGLRQLSSVMEMIQKKTEVIHEIVSQTKILSFNASVESARAGEQGKGFAIVAEEVGRLAHMTGGAAEEIHSTVSKSVQQVEELLTQAEKDLGNSFQVSHTTVQSTAEIVRESELILQEIQQNAQRTYEAVSGITVTSREQVKAIHEASKVIHEIDIATQETAKISQETQTIAQNLAAQSASLKESTNVLEILVQGKLNESLESLI
jgi:methyl-accepting chemotaxis protein